MRGGGVAQNEKSERGDRGGDGKDLNRGNEDIRQRVDLRVNLEFPGRRCLVQRQTCLSLSFSLTSIGMPLGSYMSGPSQFQVTLFSNGRTLC